MDDHFLESAIVVVDETERRSGTKITPDDLETPAALKAKLAAMAKRA